MAKAKAKRKLFRKPNKKVAPPPVTRSSSSEEDISLSHHDDSDIEIDEKMEPNVGDYAVVLVDGKPKSLKYFARVDNYDDEDDDYEVVFLQKNQQQSQFWKTNLYCTVNEDNAASFVAEDIIVKLPLPTVVLGSTTRSNQLQFNFDFTKLDFA